MPTTTKTKALHALQFGIFLLFILAAGCSKRADTPLTNLPSDRRDKSDAVLLTDKTYNQNIVLKDRVNGVDYLITENLIVNARLTVEPGVTLMFKDGAGIQVNTGGSLMAIGTPSNLIYFTSESGERGAWRGITFLSKQAGNVLSYCHIEHGGGTNEFGKANILVGSAEHSAKVELSFSEITASQEDGIILAENSTLSNFSGNTLYMNTGAPLQLFIGDAQQITQKNSYYDNGADFIRLVGAKDSFIYVPLALSRINYPYFLSGCIYCKSSFTVAAGTKIYLGKNARIVIDGTTSAASFTAIGTPDAPISFLPLYPGKAVWNSFNFVASASPDNRLEYCYISGGGSLDKTSAGVGMINIKSLEDDSSAIVIRNCKIMDSGVYGISIHTHLCGYNSDIMTANQFYNNSNGNVCFQ